MPAPIFAEFPELEGRLPFRSLGLFPTPIEPLPELLPRALEVEVWVKREDLAGERYGGNKVRKFEFLLAEAGDRPRRLITTGAYGSNHVLATAIYGREIGCSVDAVLFPQPPSPWVTRSLLAQQGLGLRQHFTRTHAGLAWVAPRALLSRPQPTIIPAGGSSPLGTVGWWSGGLEVRAQVRSGSVPRFDAVYVALGSAGTAAGLWLGLGDAATELVGVKVAPWPFGSAANVRWLAARTLRLVSRHSDRGRGPLAPRRPLLRVVRDQLGHGYGSPTPAATRALEQAARCGLALDPTYTGKTLAALISDAESGRLRGKRVLFLNSYNSRSLAPYLEEARREALPDWLPLPAIPSALLK